MVLRYLRQAPDVLCIRLLVPPVETRSPPGDGDAAIAIWWRWGESNSRPDRRSPFISTDLAARIQQFDTCSAADGAPRHLASATPLRSSDHPASMPSGRLSHPVYNFPRRRTLKDVCLTWRWRISRSFFIAGSSPVRGAAYSGNGVGPISAGGRDSSARPTGILAPDASVVLVPRGTRSRRIQLSRPRLAIERAAPTPFA